MATRIVESDEGTPVASVGFHITCGFDDAKPHAYINTRRSVTTKELPVYVVDLEVQPTGSTTFVSKGKGVVAHAQDVYDVLTAFSSKPHIYLDHKTKEAAAFHLQKIALPKNVGLDNKPGQLKQLQDVVNGLLVGKNSSIENVANGNATLAKCIADKLESPPTISYDDYESLQDFLANAKLRKAYAEVFSLGYALRYTKGPAGTSLFPATILVSKDVLDYIIQKKDNSPNTLLDEISEKVDMQPFEFQKLPNGTYANCPNFFHRFNSLQDNAALDSAGGAAAVDELADDDAVLVCELTHSIKHIQGKTTAEAELQYEFKNRDALIKKLERFLKKGPPLYCEFVWDYQWDEPLHHEPSGGGGAAAAGAAKLPYQDLAQGVNAFKKFNEYSKKEFLHTVDPDEEKKYIADMVKHLQDEKIRTIFTVSNEDSSREINRETIKMAIDALPQCFPYTSVNEVVLLPVFQGTLDEDEDELDQGEGFEELQNARNAVIYDGLVTYADTYCKEQPNIIKINRQIQDMTTFLQEQLKRRYGKLTLEDKIRDVQLALKDVQANIDGNPATSDDLRIWHFEKETLQLKLKSLSTPEKYKNARTKTKVDLNEQLLICQNHNQLLSEQLYGLWTLVTIKKKPLHHLRLSCQNKAAWEATFRRVPWYYKTFYENELRSSIDMLCDIVSDPVCGPISLNIGETKMSSASWDQFNKACGRGRLCFAYIDEDGRPKYKWQKQCETMRIGYYLQCKRKHERVPWFTYEDESKPPLAEYAKQGYTQKQINKWILTEADPDNFALQNRQHDAGNGMQAWCSATQMEEKIEKLGQKKVAAKVKEFENRHIIPKPMIARDISTDEVYYLQLANVGEAPNKSNATHEYTVEETQEEQHLDIARKIYAGTNILHVWIDNGGERVHLFTVKPSNQTGGGNGLFAGVGFSNISCDQTIGHYANKNKTIRRGGKITPLEEENTFLSSVPHLLPDGDGFYLGNFMQFINEDWDAYRHTRDLKDIENAENVQITTEDEDYPVRVVDTSVIKSGEEIYTYYGDSYKREVPAELDAPKSDEGADNDAIMELLSDSEEEDDSGEEEDSEDDEDEDDEDEEEEEEEEEKDEDDDNQSGMDEDEDEDHSGEEDDEEDKDEQAARVRKEKKSYNDNAQDAVANSSSDEEAQYNVGRKPHKRKRKQRRVQFHSNDSETDSESKPKKTKFKEPFVLSSSESESNTGSYNDSTRRNDKPPMQYGTKPLPNNGAHHKDLTRRLNVVTIRPDSDSSDSSNSKTEEGETGEAAPAENHEKSVEALEQSYKDVAREIEKLKKGAKSLIYSTPVNFLSLEQLKSRKPKTDEVTKAIQELEALQVEATDDWLYTKDEIKYLSINQLKARIAAEVQKFLEAEGISDLEMSGDNGEPSDAEVLKEDAPASPATQTLNQEKLDVAAVSEDESLDEDEDEPEEDEEELERAFIALRNTTGGPKHQSLATLDLFAPKSPNATVLQNDSLEEKIKLLRPLLRQLADGQIFCKRYDQYYRRGKSRKATFMPRYGDLTKDQLEFIGAKVHKLYRTGSDQELHHLKEFTERVLIPEFIRGIVFLSIDGVKSIDDADAFLLRTAVSE